MCLGPRKLRPGEAGPRDQESLVRGGGVVMAPARSVGLFRLQKKEISPKMFLWLHFLYLWQHTQEKNFPTLCHFVINSLSHSYLETLPCVCVRACACACACVFLQASGDFGWGILDILEI